MSFFPAISNLLGITAKGQATSANSLPVVIASDNNVNTVSAQGTRVTGTITTSSGTVTATVSQYSVATITFMGTYAGITINFEASDDGGTTYYAVEASLSSSPSSAVTSVALANNSSSMYNVTLPGVTNFRIRSSAYTSGTLNIGITPTADPMVFNVAAGITNATIAVTQSGTWTTVGGKTNNNAAPGANNMGALTVLANASVPSWTEGNEVLLSTLLNGSLRTDATTYGGTAVVTGGVAGSQAVGGPTASGSSLVANPLTVGGLAKTALPTAVSDGQVVNEMHDKFGRLVNLPQGPRDIIGTQVTTITSTTSPTTVVTAIASTFTDISTIILANTSAVITSATLSDGTNSIVFEVPASDTSGAAFPVPIPATTVNTAWTVACGTSVASLNVTVIYVKNK